MVEERADSFTDARLQRRTSSSTAFAVDMQAPDHRG